MHCRMLVCCLPTCVLSGQKLRLVFHNQFMKTNRIPLESVSLRFGELCGNCEYSAAIHSEILLDVFVCAYKYNFNGFYNIALSDESVS